MARLLDQIIVIDIESTCWEKYPPAGQESEIIEIGVCLLDVATGERLQRESLLVRPQQSTVSRFCTDLTTLTQRQVAQGITFGSACSELKSRFKTKDRLWASYGDYDRRQFERQCQSRKVAYPFGPTHLNVKNLFAIVRGLREEVPMDEALRRLGLPLEGTHHRGGDDAWNTAAILAAILASARRGVGEG